MALRPQVKRLCDAKGLKYAWVAKQIGLTPPNFDHVESGHRAAPPGYYEDLARVLQVPIELVLPEPEPVEMAAS